jgi:tRNA(Met) cytidine acetyltransferase
LKLAKQSSFDFVGTTFGATSQLLSFWSKNGFLPVRLGVNKDKASGEYSVLMLNALSPDAAIFKQQLREYFAKSFVHMLPEQYRTVSASLVSLLTWLNRDVDFFEYSEHDATSVKGFVSKERQYHTCSYSLRNWILHFLTEHLDECPELLINRVLQRLTTEELSAKFQLTGKKQLDNQLINDVAVRFHLP